MRPSPAWWLRGLILGSCLGFLSGCASSPWKPSLSLPWSRTKSDPSRLAQAGKTKSNADNSTASSPDSNGDDKSRNSFAEKLATSTTSSSLPAHSDPAMAALIEREIANFPADEQARARESLCEVPAADVERVLAIWKAVISQSPSAPNSAQQAESALASVSDPAAGKTGKTPPFSLGDANPWSETTNQSGATRSPNAVASRGQIEQVAYHSENATRTGLVQPSDWNQEHTAPRMAAARPSGQNSFGQNDAGPNNSRTEYHFPTGGGHVPAQTGSAATGWGQTATRLVQPPQWPGVNGQTTAARTSTASSQFPSYNPDLVQKPSAGIQRPGVLEFPPQNTAIQNPAAGQFTARRPAAGQYSAEFAGGYSSAGGSRGMMTQEQFYAAAAREQTLVQPPAWPSGTTTHRNSGFNGQSAGQSARATPSDWAHAGSPETLQPPQFQTPPHQSFPQGISSRTGPLPGMAAIPAPASVSGHTPQFQATAPRTPELTPPAILESPPDSSVPTLPNPTFGASGVPAISPKASNSTAPRATKPRVVDGPSLNTEVAALRPDQSTRPTTAREPEIRPGVPRVQPDTLLLAPGQRLPGFEHNESMLAVASTTPRSSLAALPISPGSGPDNLAQWLSQTEATVTQLAPAAQLEEQTAYIRQHVHLRLAYLIAGQTERALQPIPGIAPEDQEFWTQVLWGMHNYFDAEQIRNPSDRAAQTIQQFNTAVLRLQSRAPLELRNLNLCTRINSFGDYEKFAQDTFTPGQQVLLYAEIRNFNSELTGDGRYRTLLKSTLQIFKPGPQGELVEERKFPATEDLCRNQRHDYFHSYLLELPSKIGSGPHVLKLIVEDDLGHKVATATLNVQLQ